MEGQELLEMGRDLKVLYVEDDAMTRTMMGRHLNSLFSQVFMAYDGQEGLLIYENEGDFDLILSDISMPGMDGLEMIAEMKKRDEEVRTILISAHDDAHNLVKAIELGVDHYLIKPVYRDRLFEILSRLIFSINQERQIEAAQKALLESEKRYRTLVDNLPLGIYRKEAGLCGSFVMVNPALVSMLGFQKDEELLNVSFQDLLDEEGRMAFKDESFQSKEFCLYRKRGEPLDVLMSSRPVKETNKVSCYDGTIEDITPRKKAERQLASYMKEIERKNTALEKANQKILEDLDKARLIHQQLLPGTFPKVEGISLAAYHEPAANIGGDFFNLHLLEDSFLIYLTDVTGHGLDGALLSVFVRETVNSYLNIHQREEISPSSLLSFIGSRYCIERFPHDYFICMIIGIYEMKKGLFSFVNAGIQVGPYLTTEKDLFRVDSTGPPISTVFGPDLLDLSPRTLKIEAGHSFLLLTDGIIEEKKGDDMYGEERLKKVFFANRRKSPEEIIASITHDFSQFQGENEGQDDVTLFLFKRESSSSLMEEH